MSITDFGELLGAFFGGAWDLFSIKLIAGISIQNIILAGIFILGLVYFVRSLKGGNNDD